MMRETMRTIDRLIEDLKLLKLDAFARSVEEEIDRHPDEREAIIEALTRLATAETASRQERSVTYRISQAKFKQIQTVDTFDFAYNASTRKMKNRYLKLLDAEITEQAISALFVGGCGLGKTHLARALGYGFCQSGVRVRFTTMSEMTLNLVAADSNGTLKRAMDHFIQPTLLIIDELGYISLRELESNLVFQVISLRHDRRRPSVVTTNRSFGEWNQVFHNDAIARAILDRLIERSEVFHLEGKSYRETHRQRLKT